jgi:lambda family phage portal protein
LQPGEDYIPHTPNRPNTGLDPFMRYMLREVASGIGVSYESLSRDYSQSNYSSSRLALLDDRDLWKMLQGWFIRNFRQPIHKAWLQQAVLARAIPGISVDEYATNMRKFEAVRFKPRGWSWVDPTKEVQAYKDAVLCGFKTVSDVVAETAGGQDIEDVLEQRRRELDLMAEYDLKFETEPAEVAPPAPVAAPPTPDDDEETDDEAERRVRVLSLAKRSV